MNYDSLFVLNQEGSGEQDGFVFVDLNNSKSINDMAAKRFKFFLVSKDGMA